MLPKKYAIVTIIITYVRKSQCEIPICSQDFYFILFFFISNTPNALWIISWPPSCMGFYLLIRWWGQKRERCRRRKREMDIRSNNNNAILLLLHHLRREKKEAVRNVLAHKYINLWFFFHQSLQTYHDEIHTYIFKLNEC